MKQILNIVLTVSLIITSWAVLGTLAMEEYAKLQCLKYGTADSVVIGLNVYCRTVRYGDAYFAPLSTLKDKTSE